MASADVIVVGLGAFGSAVAYHCARRGLRVLGIDRFAPPHDQGSSHGETRAIREACFEDPRYVPYVQRAYEQWHALMVDADDDLLVETGGLLVGPGPGRLVQGAQQSAQLHGLPYDVLEAAAISRRFPQFRAPADYLGIFEPRAGVLLPERCIAAHLSLATRHGATLKLGETALTWEQSGEGIAVATDSGTYAAEQLVIATGAWLESLLQLHLPLEIERQVQFWLPPSSRQAQWQIGSCPVFLFETDAGIFYGLPDVGSGLKVARHHGGETSVIARVERRVSPNDFKPLARWLHDFVPTAPTTYQRAKVCMYTLTPDEHFLVDRHPLYGRVWIAGGGSGHGFKFSSVIGIDLAACIAGEPNAIPPMFRLQRLFS